MESRKFWTCTVEENVATVTINNPPVNALSTEVVMELGGLLDEIAVNPAVKCAIITGSGESFFIAGANIKEIVTYNTYDKARQMAARGQEVFTKIETMGKPFIAAINGVCLGGGNELAMACHIRVASDMAKLGQPEINLGIIPGFGGTQRLPRLVGKGKALEMILSGDMVTAKEAHRIGLVDRIVPPADLLKEAKGLAKKIAAKGLPSIDMAIEAVGKGLEQALDKGLALEADLFGKVCATEDAREGLTAFIEKRQPKFKDR